MLRQNLSSMAVLSITGADKVSFLQGQLTADIRKLSATQGSLSAYCNVKGRVVALGELLAFSDSILWLLPKSMLSNVQKRLQRFALFAKVQLADASADFTLYGLTDKKAVQQCRQRWQLQQEYQIAQQQGCCILNYPQQLLFITTATDHTALINELPLATDDEWLLQRLRSGLASIEEPQSAELLPHPLNLIELGAISFDKGCFVGQEIIARTQYRGKVKKHLRHLQVQNSQQPPVVFDEVQTAAQTAGKVVNVCATDRTGCYELLVMLQDDVLNQELKLTKQPTAVLTL